MNSVDTSSEFNIKRIWERQSRCHALLFEESYPETQGVSIFVWDGRKDVGTVGLRGPQSRCNKVTRLRTIETERCSLEQHLRSVSNQIDTREGTSLDDQLKSLPVTFFRGQD